MRCCSREAFSRILYIVYAIYIYSIYICSQCVLLLLLWSAGGFCHTGGARAKHVREIHTVVKSNLYTDTNTHTHTHKHTFVLFERTLRAVEKKHKFITHQTTTRDYRYNILFMHTKQKKTTRVCEHIERARTADAMDILGWTMLIGNCLLPCARSLGNSTERAATRRKKTRENEREC